MLSQVRAGGIELLAAPSLTLSTLVPLSGLPSIGFAFRSYDQVWAAMDGGVGDVVRDAIGKAGIVPMKKIWDNGFRQITSSSSRQLNSVEDLKGFKIRVPVTALLTSLFSGLGALPSSISSASFTHPCRPTSWKGRKIRWRRFRRTSSMRCRNIARCRTIAGADTGSSPTAARCELPADLLEIVNAQFRCRRCQGARRSVGDGPLAAGRTHRQGHDFQQARPGAVQGGAGEGRLLCAVAEDLWRRGLGEAGAVYGAADLRRVSSPV